MTGLSKERNSIRLYDKLLYWWAYFWVSIDHKIDEYQDYRANIRWIKRNGRY